MGGLENIHTIYTLQRRRGLVELTDRCRNASPVWTSNTELTRFCWNFPQVTLTLGEWRVLPPQADNSVEVLSMVVCLTRNCGAED